MASIRICDATVTVEDTAQNNREGRPVFEWTLKLDSGREWSESDLCGPVCGPEPSEEEMLGTFLSFLGAAIESRLFRERTGREGDNEDLFPADLLDWAAQHSDEISIVAIEMEEALD
ncbi:MAG: hypothetical protein AB7L09_01865 [Nitrospira sp.]